MVSKIVLRKLYYMLEASMHQLQFLAYKEGMSHTDSWLLCTSVVLRYRETLSVNF